MKAYKSLAIFSIALFSLVLILSVFKSAPKELPEPIAIKEAIELDLTTTNLTVEAEEPRAKITIEKQETLTPQQPIVQKTAKQKLEKLTPSTDTASLESNHSSQAPKDIDQVEILQFVMKI